MKRGVRFITETQNIMNVGFCKVNCSAVCISCAQDSEKMENFECLNEDRWKFFGIFPCWVSSTCELSGDIYVPPLTPHWTTRPKVLDRHALWRNLALPGLVQFKPGLVHWACSGQAQAALDGARGLVYPTPKGLNGRQKSRSMPARVPSR